MGYAIIDISSGKTQEETVGTVITPTDNEQSPDKRPELEERGGEEIDIIERRRHAEEAIRERIRQKHISTLD